MTSKLATPSSPGRPRSLQAQRAVLNAVQALVDKGGYPAATMEAIAARSGVAKTTIYRWWPNRPSLVVDLLFQVAAEVAPPPAGADPVGALRTELRLVAEAIDGLPGRILLSLLGETQHDEEVHKALMDRLFTPRRKATAKVIRQAQDSGELQPDVPPLVAVDLLFGPLFYRKFVLHQSVSGTFEKQVARHVLGRLLTRAAKRR
jgi:AcrR family transcriptional regulator